MREQMRAVKYRYLTNNNVPNAEMVMIDKPEIKKADEVLIRILNVSLCGTDVNALRNPPAFNLVEGVTIGHECCGVVEAVGGEVTNCKVGDHVVVHPNIWCGKCPSCRTGHINLCHHFKHIGDRIDGAMADYLCIEERMVYVIDKKVPPYIAALTEPLACVLNGTTTVRSHPGDEVLVIGAGPIGLLFTMLYKKMGARVTVSEPQPQRQQAALDCGADLVVNPLEQDLKEATKDFAPEGFEIVAEANGTQIGTAIDMAKMGGQIAAFGVNQIKTPTVNQYNITLKELKIQGTYITKGTFPRAIKIIENRIIPIEKIVSRVETMENIMPSVRAMAKGEVNKIVIEVNKE